jgi:peptidyl-prolyl cis-trans isomerase C
MKLLLSILRTSFVALTVAAALAAPGASAQGGGADEVLAENSHAKVTRGDYEAELLRLPPDMRAGFGNSGKRVYDLLARLLLTKSLAAEARKNGLDKDPEAQHRIALEVDRLQAGLQVARIEEDAAKAFDFRRPQLEARARELYLANRDKYHTPEQVSVSHILFDTKKHTPEEALKLAQEARAKVLAGADFSALAKEVSEDSTSLRNSGRLDYFDKTQMDPAFSEAAFALRNVGDVSEPIRSSFGYHVIRLEGRHPASVRTYEQVKHQILADQRAKYIDEQREVALEPLKNDPATKVNQAAVDALIVKVDPAEAEKAEKIERPRSKK